MSSSVMVGIVDIVFLLPSIEELDFVAIFYHRHASAIRQEAARPLISRLWKRWGCWNTGCQTRCCLAASYVRGSGNRHTVRLQTQLQQAFAFHHSTMLR